MRSIKCLSFVLGTAGAALFFFVLWHARTFGHVQIEQILWTMSNDITGFDSSIALSALWPVLGTVCAALLWGTVLFFPAGVRTALVHSPRLLIQTLRLVYARLRSEHTALSARAERRLACTALAAAALALCLGLALVDYSFQIHSYWATRSSVPEQDFFARHYRVPLSPTVRFPSKKNLVVVLAESMELSYSDPALVRSYTPQLDTLRKKSFSSDRIIQFYGATQTIAAITNWFFGVPLKLPDTPPAETPGKEHGFFSGALSIFDILQDHGYRLVMVMGSDRAFSNQSTLLTEHGSFRILDKQHWQSEGWSLEQHKGTDWGYTDAFILARAREQYDRLLRLGEPFVLFVQTIDTHAPNGYAPVQRRELNDIRDAVVETDRLLGGFVTALGSLKHKKTALAILGDHLFMGEPEFLSRVPERRVYNAFYGDLPPAVESKRTRPAMTADIAPTLLHLTGARWYNGRFGIGTSLFSRTSSLAEQLDKATLNQRIAQPSAFYSHLYGATALPR